MTAPLREIVERFQRDNGNGISFPFEVLSCGHSVPRPLGLGEDATKPAKAKRRRCHLCQS